MNLIGDLMLDAKIVECKIEEVEEHGKVLFVHLKITGGMYAEQVVKKSFWDNPKSKGHLRDQLMNIGINLSKYQNVQEVCPLMKGMLVKIKVSPNANARNGMSVFMEKRIEQDAEDQEVAEEPPNFDDEFEVMDGESAF